MIDSILGLFSHDVAIDLGTANTLVAVRGKGVMIREPSVVARHKKTKELVAIGNQAKLMWGKTPATLEVVRPLRNGVIADFDATEAMLQAWIRMIHEPYGWMPRVPRPRVIIGIPSGVTEVERRAVQQAAIRAGARKAWLIEEAMAAAIGSGAKIDQPVGVFIVDIGGGTMEIAVISMSGTVVKRSVRLAGDSMDEAIVKYYRLKHALLIGSATAERLKITLGSIKDSHDPDDGEEGSKVKKTKSSKQMMVIRGRNLETGLPESRKTDSAELGKALESVVNEIVLEVQDAIDEIPPELMSDILERGIMLAGGGALINGLDELMADKTKMPVQIADDPLTCVVRGCLKLFDQPQLLENVMVTGGLK